MYKYIYTDIHTYLEDQSYLHLHSADSILNQSPEPSTNCPLSLMARVFHFLDRLQEMVTIRPHQMIEELLKYGDLETKKQ